MQWQFNLKKGGSDGGVRRMRVPKPPSRREGWDAKNGDRGTNKCLVEQKIEKR